MARKTKTLTIESGRDVGKTFLITEMPLLQADRWAQQALFALAKSGISGTDAIDTSEGMLEIGRAHVTPVT